MTASALWTEQNLLAFDLETTGVDRFSDVPVSYALLVVRGGVVVGRHTSLVDPGREIPLAASAVHGIDNEQVRQEGMPLGIAVRHVARMVLDATLEGLPIVGMKLDFDLTMLDACYRRETGRGLVDDGFRGPVLDALVIDRHVERYRRGKRTLADLCMRYGVCIDHAHDAAADAKAAVDVVRAMCTCFPELLVRSPWELHAAQASWHREWTASFAEWRRRKGLSPIDDEDAPWPIASAVRQVGAEAAV